MTTVGPARAAVEARGAAVSAKAGRVESIEEWFRSWDGEELFYRVWWPGGAVAMLGDVPKEALILFHRGHEHSGRFEELVEKLGVLERGVPVFAWDARGHGRSPGERGYADEFMTLVRDVEAFVRHINGAYGIATSDMSVLAHSVGSVVVCTWVHDYAPPIRKLVLVAPAFRVKLYVPGARAGLRAMMKVRKRVFVKSYVKGKMLTHDEKQADSYDKDLLISKQIAANILLEMHDTATRIIDDAGAIGAPTFVLTAGNDWVVKNRAIEDFFAGLSSPVKMLKEYPGFYHAILCEKGRDTAIADVKAFLAKDFPARIDTTAEEAFTRREFENLSAPLPGWSWKGIKYGIQRGFLKSAGRLSKGIRIGLEAGFDSGESLDHIYTDSARGWTFLGLIIDRAYIDAIGWQGIRQRKIHLKEMLGKIISWLRQGGAPVRIMDVAAGPGRYLIETVRQQGNADIVALLRDWSESGLAEGRKLAEAMGVKAVHFQRGDAFAEAELGEARVAGCRPNVVVVSGLYELFPDNAKVEASLKGIAKGMEKEGCLIYTCQPWHPQMEMIARTLPNREGKPWVMRRRSQAEMDRLVREAGFEKMGMAVDRWGIFTVSVAQKRG
jgi:alpha-beta hydrolase superfamily lysophospholipase/SAM-dependent methyltransferase